MEINFLVGKLKHTVRRTRKADEAATGKDLQVRLLETRVRELSAELSNLRAFQASLRVAIGRVVAVCR